MKERETELVKSSVQSRKWGDEEKSFYGFLRKKPEQIINDYHQFISAIKDLFIAKKNKTGLLSKEIIDELGISQTQFYYRLNNPDNWTKDELLLLIKILNRKKK